MLCRPVLIKSSDTNYGQFWNIIDNIMANNAINIAVQFILNFNDRLTELNKVEKRIVVLH